MPFPQMTTRRWMIAVAIVSLLLAGEVTRRRWATLSAEYTWRFTLHSLTADIARNVAAEYASRKPRNEGSEETIAAALRSAQHYDRLARQYERAARRPWLPVPPDPPPPE